MIRAADIREWRNRDVVDAEGRKIGPLEAVYVDTRTDEPAVVTVLIGLPTRRRLTFVPLTDAILGPDYVKVGYLRDQVKSAPSMGTDDVLPAEEEKAVFAHYDLPYQPGANGERQLARP
ncbi:PRC-barrel domain-containing protein [Streptomyces sp. NPDC051320]|uniref:PRC-barrel domain-containing protein n=1 Tax=Streptomyces sp. NPDC051320 TaxID=3154644 RepID=UPI003434AE66